MDKYLNYTLLFKTQSDTYKGILLSIDYNTNTMKFQELATNKPRALNILDIEDIQIIDKPHNKQVGNQLQNIKMSIKLNDSYNKMNIHEKENYKNDERENHKNNLNKENNRTKILEKNVKIQKEPSKNAKSLVSHDLHYKAISKAINFYGPSESCLFYNVARIVCNFLEKQKDEKFLIYIDDSFYARIGICLCTMFIKKGFNFEVICNVKDDVRYCQEFQYYKNNGGIFTSKPRTYDSILLFGKNDNFNCTKNCYIFDENDGKDYKNIVLFMLGMVYECYKTFKGDIYLINCNFSSALYEEFGIKKLCTGDLRQIKKQL